MRTKTWSKDASLGSQNPYRYPSVDPQNQIRYSRSRPATTENLILATEDWLAALDETALHEATEHVRSLDFTQKCADGRLRLGLGNEPAAVGMTFFYRTPILYDILTRELRKLKAADSAAPICVHCYGAGYLDMRSNNPVPDLSAFRTLNEICGGGLRGLVIEPYEILFMLLAEFLSAELHVFDMDARVIENLTAKPCRYLAPLFDFDGRPVTGDRLNFAETFVCRAGGSPNNLIVTPDGRFSAYDLTISKEWTDKIHATVFDLSTELLPPGPLTAANFYLQTAYFMDPLLQHAAWIKIVNRTKLKGFIVSDYLLTEAEAHVLGLKIRVVADALLESDAAGRDKFIHVYQKTATPPLVDTLMQRIAKIQG